MEHFDYEGTFEGHWTNKTKRYKAQTLTVENIDIELSTVKFSRSLINPKMVFEGGTFEMFLVKNSLPRKS